MTAVGLTGYGIYTPDRVLTGEDVAALSDIPVSVVTEKMGLRRKHVCPPDEDHCTDMAVAAGEEALADAGVAPETLDLVLYHGSEYKDYVVWSAAADIAHRLGATAAFATESFTLCAGCPVAIGEVAAQLRTGRIDRALLVTASREEDLIDYDNADSSFMFNFGSGGAAYVLEADPATDRTRAHVRGTDAVTDGSFAQDVIMPAGGSRHPPSHETVTRGEHALDVPDPEGMKERLAPVSLPNYLSVADGALSASGYGREDVDFVAVTHMKRSFHERLLAELGLDPETDAVYLAEYGHVQSADQVIAIDEGLAAGRLQGGDVVLFLAAGTGYTWAAAVLDWLA